MAKLDVRSVPALVDLCRAAGIGTTTVPEGLES
jgi:hypothetical protein